MDTANKYLTQDLIQQASASARWRGHSLRPWVPTGPYSAITDCRVCGAEVAVDGMPPANGIHVGGSAVAVNCHKETK